jgi:putative colanic acid biosynthesis UDP-glucose lipid carrier transferase
MENAKRGGIIQSNKSSFATIYRLLDLVSVTLLYFLVLYRQSVAIESHHSILLFVGIITFNVSAEALDLYRSWRTQPTSALLRTTSFVWLITMVCVVVLVYLWPQQFQTENNVVVLWLCVMLPALLLWRMVFRQVMFMIRRNGRNYRTAAIVGATPLGYNLSLQIMENEHLGIKLVGLYDDRDASRIPHEFQNQIVGNVCDAIRQAKAGEIDYIYVAMPMSAESRILEILQQCSDTTCNVYIIPNFFVYNLLNARWQSVGSMQTLSVFDTPFQGASTVLKRLEDLFLGTLFLLLTAIPMLIIAACIKATSSGPVLFKQDRYGLDGRKIKVYKFRSMKVSENGDTVRQATQNDNRVTPLGAFLRRTSLDELPQFINVVQGRMSIVGPRPHAVAHNEQYRSIIDGYMLRHKVKPGITGLAQINGFRGETKTINKMVGRIEYDLDYIHRWTVWLDMKIIFATVFKGFTSENAY